MTGKTRTTGKERETDNDSGSFFGKLTIALEKRRKSPSSEGHASSAVSAHFVRALANKQRTKTDFDYHKYFYIFKTPYNI